MLYSFVPNMKNKNTKKYKPVKTKEEENKLNTFHDLLSRYLSGEVLSEQERILVESIAMRTDNEVTDADAMQTGEIVWSSIQQNIKRKPWRISFKMMPYHHYAVAAIIMAMIGIGSLLFLFNSMQTSKPLNIDIVADATLVTETLPDGSVVYLNLGSKLHYDKNKFNVKNRELWLVGEAFFEVSKNPEKPFLVHGDQITTTVKGTSFNVKAYLGTPTNVVSVRDGTVEVSTVKGETLAVLTRNRQLTLNTKALSYRTDSLDWQNAGGWIDGSTLVLNMAGIEEIKLKMKQYYGMELSVKGDAMSEVRLCGKYPYKEGAKIMLRQLCDIYGMKYSIKGNRVDFYR